MNTTPHPSSSRRLLLSLMIFIIASAVSSQAQLTRAFQSFPSALTNEIKYVIIIYPENRSFDSLYGCFPGANGIANAVYNQQFGRTNNTPLPFLPQPTLSGMNLLSSGNDLRFPGSLPNRSYNASPFVPDKYCTGDMAHAFYLEQYQINNPAYTWIAGDPKNAGGTPMSKFVVWSDNPGLTMSFYDEQNGGEGSVAKQFVLADNCFHSAFGGSFLNHQWLIAARTPIWPAHPAEGSDPSGAGHTPKDPASPSGYWWPAAQSANRGYGATLSDRTLTSDPTLPGFPFSNNSTNLNPGDFWAVNTILPLRGPAGGYSVPAVDLSGNDYPEVQGLTSDVILTGQKHDTNVFDSRIAFAPISADPISRRLPLQTYDTIGDRLNDAGISWAWFSGGWNDARNGVADFLFQFHHQPFAYFAKYALAKSPVYPINGSTNAPIPGVDSTDPNNLPFGYGLGSANHLADEDADFYRLLDAGQLPRVSFVKPIGEDNSHPGYASVKRGQAWVANIVDHIKNSPVWPHTVIFICYDEHGGLYDHAVPPVIDRWGPGSRIPFIIASPWCKRGFVDHNQYETVSILSFIEGLFNLPPLNTRDARALPPVAAFAGEPDLYLEARAGQPVSYRIPAYNHPVSYSWTGNSHGLKLDSNNGTITGTPGESGAFTVDVTVNGSATNSPAQNSNTLMYSLEVDVK